MTKNAELERLDRAIKDGEIRIRTVQNNIDQLTKEIDTLVTLEKQLEENVGCLKKKNVTVIATEFKKAKDDLARTKTRLINLGNERENFNKSLENAKQVMEKAREHIEKLQKEENNVLQGKFGRKDGQG